MPMFADDRNNVFIQEDEGIRDLKSLEYHSNTWAHEARLFHITPRLFRMCRVTMVAATMPYDQPLMAIAGPDELVEYGGRVCYMSFEKKRPPVDGLTLNQTYLRHIRKVKHGSVTEHASWSFDIRDISRNCTHELVRHRVGTAFSQLSSRYVDQWLPTAGYTPGVYQAIGVASEDMMPTLMASIDWYYKVLYSGLREGKDIKDARSIARHALPGCAGTRMLLTMNARALDHFFRMRGAISADPEIRSLACAIHELVRENNLFQHWRNEGEFLVEDV